MQEENHPGQTWNKAASTLKEIFNKDKVWLLLCVLIIGILYWFLGCPIRHYTGIPCLGCGMTRAVACALQLDFAGAFYHHPLFVLLPPLLWLLASKMARSRPRLRNLGLGLIGAAFIVVYLLRMFVFHSDVLAVAWRF